MWIPVPFDFDFVFRNTTLSSICNLELWKNCSDEKLEDGVVFSDLYFLP